MPSNYMATTNHLCLYQEAMKSEKTPRIKSTMLPYKNALNVHKKG